MMHTITVSTRRASVPINQRVPFKSHGAIRGYGPGNLPTNTGELPPEWAAIYREKLSRIAYVVTSYDTPIYWVLDSGVDYRPDVRYSVTTSRHQGQCPRADREVLRPTF